MEITLYENPSVKLWTSSEGLQFSMHAQSDTVRHMTVRTQQSFHADRLAVTLQFRSRDYEAIAQHFHYIPCIKQRKENICGAHVLRSPAAILSDGDCFAALIPDMHSLDPALAELVFLDMRFDENNSSPPCLTLGLIHQKTEPHTYYVPTGEALTLPQGTALSFYLLIFNALPAEQMLHEVQTFLFETFSKPYLSSILPQTVPFDVYAQYGNAFGESMYHEYAAGGGIALSTFRKADGHYSGREYEDDLFFHCWFNNIRTARELHYFGQRQNNAKWVRMAQQAVKLLLSAPQHDGLFPTIYAPHDGGWIGSSRHGGGNDYYSLPDCAWTAYQLMLYQDQYGTSAQADVFLKKLADGLLHQLLPDGSFPVWVRKDGETDAVTQRLLGTTASMPCALFLAEYALRYGGDEYLQAAANYLDDTARRCLPQQKFEDFELYYSCSAKPEGFYDPISRMYGQNTLAMQWMAEACLTVYRLTGRQNVLTQGRFALDLLCMYQQVWNPPYLSLYAFGGFGVMNTDAEWNDARQAQFAETLLHYYDATGEPVYLKRGLAALRASFALMVMEENAAVSPKTITPRERNNERHGGMAENYGHAGSNERSGQSGFHWGSGSALVAAAEFLRRGLVE